MSKIQSILVPVSIFLATSIIGSVVVLHAFIIDDMEYSSKPEYIAAEQVESPAVMGINIQVEADEAKTNAEPICKSFDSIASLEIEEDGVYPIGTTFDFKVVAFDEDQSDTIDNVVFSIFDANSKENIAEFICNSENNCEQMVNEADSDTEVQTVTSILKKYSFPDGGDYMINAVVESSDGTSVKCAVLNENE